MAFFTSDLRVAEAFGNPQVKQVIGPGAARSWTGDMGGQQGMLSNLGVSTQQTSGSFSYTTPTAAQLWSQVGTGVTGTLGAGASAIAGGTTTGAITTDPVVGTDGEDVPSIPVTVEDTTTGDSGDGYVFGSGTSSYEEQYGEQADWYRAYDYLNMSPLKKAY